MNSNGQWQYWCGSNPGSNWCQSTVNASLFNYPSGITVKLATNDSTTNTTCISNSSEAASAGTSLAALQTCTDTASAQKQIQMMGVKVGTSVGIPLFVIALLLGVLLLFERRSKQKLIQQVSTVPADTKIMEAESPRVTAPLYELGGTADPAEMPSKRDKTKPANSSYS